MPDPAPGLLLHLDVLTLELGTQLFHQGLDERLQILQRNSAAEKKPHQELVLAMSSRSKASP